jgi:hypothetical protein
VLIRQNKQISQLHEELLTEVFQNKVMLMSICGMPLSYKVTISATIEINYIKTLESKVLLEKLTIIHPF